MKVVKITAITATEYDWVEIKPLVNPRLAIIRPISPLGVMLTPIFNESKLENLFMRAAMKLPIIFPAKATAVIIKPNTA